LHPAAVPLQWQPVLSLFHKQR